LDSQENTWVNMPENVIVMMDLLDVVFMSEKRKGVLLSLYTGSKEMQALLKSLRTTRQALLPQLRILENSCLISHNKDKYEMTVIGRLIADKMIPLLGTVKVLDTDIGYWGRHNLDFIPPHLMKRLQELGECSVVVPSLQEMHEFNRGVHNRSLKSGSFFEVSSSFKSDFRMLFADLAQRGIRMSFIISPELMDHLKKERFEEFKQYLGTEGTEFYLYPQKIPLITFVQNDFCLLLEMLTKEGACDNTQLVCCDPGALEWGKELFEHYRHNSTLISGI